MAFVLVAAGCASGGGPATSSVRVDQGKLAARMAILQELSEPAAPPESGDRSTVALGGDTADANAGLRRGQSDVQGGAGSRTSRLGCCGGAPR